jgi:hypothetical protein
MSPIEAAARSDAEFDGRPWSNLSRLTRERYIERATKAHSAATRAAYERAATEIERRHASSEVVGYQAAATVRALIDKPAD